MKEKARYLFLTFLFPALIFADSITLKDGRIYSGAIINADAIYINIQVEETTTVQVPHTLVESVTFRYADVVYLLSGTEIKCKILEEKFPNLRMVTADGHAEIRLADLKRYFYNSADSLTIRALPETGPVFNNQKSFKEEKKLFKQSIYFDIAGGIIYPPGKEWQKNFITSNSLMGVLLQAQFGLTLINHVSVYFGYTYSQYDNTTEGELCSQINTGYYHGGVEYFNSFNELPFFEFFIGGDIGLLQTWGNIYTYSYRNIDLKDGTASIAFRPKIGVRTDVTNNIDVSLNVGYFIAKEKSYNVPSVPDLKVNVPLNGWTFFASAKFHFPIKMW